MNERKILIVEDSLTQADMLRFLLEKEGYKVTHCLNGEQALNLLPDELPGLVISDIIMPSMNGYELCKRIKEDSKLNNIPVLLLTSLADAEDIIIGLECGADNYLMKPYDENLLVDRVQTMYKKVNPMARENINQLYDIIFDGKKYKMKASREKILDMMVSVYEAAVQKTNKLQETQIELNRFRSSLKRKVHESTSDLSDKVQKKRGIEESIKLSEKQYRNLIENAIPGVFLANNMGELKFLNQALLDLLAYPQRDDLLNKSFKLLFSDIDDFDKIMEHLEKDKMLENYEVQILSNSGKKIWAIINLVLRESQISGFIIDISERKETEEKEKHYQEALKITKEKAEESACEKSIFLSNISHDIKNPLNAISGFSSLLNDPGITAKQKKEYHSHIVQNTDLLSSLIKNILDLSKIEASRLRIEKNSCKLNDLLDDTLRAIQSKRDMYGRGNVALELDKGNPDRDFTILIDQERLAQIFENLLDNALKFTIQGKIQFGYEISNKELLFYVKDSGIGIEIENQERVLNRFQKVEPRGNIVSGGAGLGLTISTYLVEMMHGKLWLTSNFGQGTEVYFRLSLSELENKKVKPIIQTTRDELVSFAGKHILVADDNEMNFMLIRAYLADTGALISWARDGLEAVEMCKSESNFNIVLMDLQMPNMDGFEAAAEIRSFQPQLPIVAVTAYSKNDVIEQVDKIEFEGYLKKPLVQTDFLNQLKSFLRPVIDSMK